MNVFFVKLIIPQSFFFSVSSFFGGGLGKSLSMSFEVAGAAAAVGVVVGCDGGTFEADDDAAGIDPVSSASMARFKLP